jgi:RNA polymerase sigma-70 factor (family 1)
MQEADIHDLIKRIKASDHEAFGRIFKMYSQSIYHFLVFKIREADIAEDLLQEVFVTLWSKRASLDESRSFKSYLYTIAENLALNHIRHENVIGKHLEQSAKTMFTNVDNPLFILEEKEWNQRVSHAIQSLPENTREIFLMSRIEDLTYAEIGDRLSLSVKAVEAHIVKALRLLREQLPFKL